MKNIDEKQDRKIYKFQRYENKRNASTLCQTFGVLAPLRNHGDQRSIPCPNLYAQTIKMHYSVTSRFEHGYWLNSKPIYVRCYSNGTLAITNDAVT